MRRTFVALASATLVLAACGNAAENLAEKAVEAQTGGEIDLNDGSIVVQSDDGDATIVVQSDDEKISISGTDESGQDITIEMGGIEVPDDFPMPVFEPGEVTHVSVYEMATQSSYSVTVEIDPGNAADALAFYQDWLEGEQMSVTTSDVMVIGESDDITSIVQVADYGDYSEVILTWTPNS